jgi:hypothetical protein
MRTALASLEPALLWAGLPALTLSSPSSIPLTRRMLRLVRVGSGRRRHFPLEDIFTSICLVPLFCQRLGFARVNVQSTFDSLRSPDIGLDGEPLND